MFKYLNFSKLNIVSNFEFRISNLFIAFLIFAPSGASGAPAQKEIQTLDPTTAFYVTPFDSGVDDALRRHCMLLRDRDITKTDFGVSFGLGGKVEVWQTPVYRITDGRKEKIVRSWGLTVGEVLSDGGIEVGTEDAVSPNVAMAISPDIKISIIRVSQTEVRITEGIDFDVIEKDDSTLERGKTKVTQEGVAGSREKTYLVRREDGEEVSRTLTSNKVVKEPQDKIILHGTKIIILSTQAGRASRSNLATASKRYPRDTLLRVTNLANGKSVETVVRDYGPEEYTGCVLDLYKPDWEKIALIGIGFIDVKIEEIKQ